MGKSWDLSVKGKGHKVIVDGSEAGKDVIRVDGRVAARPLDYDETQRAFMIEGRGYSLRRSGSKDFELISIGSGPDRAPVPTTVATATPRVFNNVILWSGVAIIVAVLLVWAVW